ncbi:phospholipase D-like domain-containing protein [Thioalkalivibrio sp. ALJ3]|uniref:phospholipase D-like domain-containing protein n=1 Tax=Thioalkalivibrio sp. ALJ3 TaxID=1240557 RepID=UPI000360D6C9|nr:phospholipase D-like domain-containing protein [Thioalkalivibrio sp. ALJ3]
MLGTGWTASITAIAVFALAVVSVMHALLQRRETGTVIAWVGLIVLLPLGGSILYWMFGVNRIRRRAHALREGHLLVDPAAREANGPGIPSRWARLLSSGDRLAPFRTSADNSVRPLTDGDQAYAAMLGAIDRASRSITLATYIFDYDVIGQRFVRHLKAARDRGVEVRVLIDGIGARYSRRNTLRFLKRAGIPAAAFMPVHHLPRTLAAFNLRNHRKMLLVDGEHGFTGGMNIRRGHSASDPGPHPIQDLHFEVRGPICLQLQRVFAEDWQFSTQEALEGTPWFPEETRPAGALLCRALPDGPDEDFEVIKFTLLAAIAEARERITVVTPYFLPDLELLGALKAAALRGIEVDLLLPERNNLRLVEWATRPLHGELLARGCRIWLTPPPFNHSKMMLVDGEWLLVGSANWDPRSLRLNFECNLECLDRDLGQQLGAWAEDLRTRSHPLTLEDVHARPLPARLRDGAARLLTPYL